MQSPSITSKVVAGILSVVAPVAAAFPAAAQNVAVPAVCEKYRADAPSHAQCFYDEKGKQIAALKQHSAAVEDNTACTNAMLAGIKSGRYKVDDIKRIYAGRPPQSVKSCDVLALLPKG